MTLELAHLFDDDSAVSPVVGVVIVIGFVVFVGMGLFLFGQGLISGNENPRVNAEYALEIENTSNIDVVYDTGEEFNPQNTNRIFIIGENRSEGEFGPIMVYNDSDVTEQPGVQTELTEGMVVLSQERADNSSWPNAIEPGSSLQVVWEPQSQPNTQIVIDEVVVPDRATIIQQVDQNGTITVGSGEIVVGGGCDPRVNSSCA